MTKSRWLELTGKQQWDVQVALRGPDCQHSEPIKWITTSVIRWAMHSIMRVGGTLNEDLGVIIIPNNTFKLDHLIKEKQGDVRAMCWSPTHFFNHVVEAAHACDIMVWGVNTGTYMEAVNTVGPAWALTSLYHKLKGDPNQSILVGEIRRHMKAQFGIDVTKPHIDNPKPSNTPCPSFGWAMSGEEE